MNTLPSSHWSLHRLAAPLLCVALLAGCDAGGGSRESTLARATQSLAEHRTREAILELKTYLGNNADDAEARSLLGRAYIVLGDGFAAEKEFDKALNLAGPSAALHEARLKALLLQSRYDDVVAFDETPWAQEPGVLVAKAEAQVLLGQPRAAAATLAELPPGDAPDGERPEIRRVHALIAIASGDLAQARTLVDELREAEPDNPELLMLSGDIHLGTGDFASAVTDFTRAAELSDDNPFANVGRFSAEIGQGELDAAAKTLALLRKTLAYKPLLNYLRGYLAFARGDLPAAKTALLDVLKLVPHHSKSQKLLGKIAFSEGQFEQSVDYLSTAARAGDETAALGRLIAAAKLLSDRPEEALVAVDQYLDHNSTNPQDLALIGSANLALGRKDEAIAQLTRASELDPTSVSLRKQLAMAQLATNDVKGAIENLELLSGDSSEISDAHLLLYYAHLRTQDFDSAVEVARDLVKRHPKHPMPYNLTGGVLTMVGEYNGARAAYRKALDMDPKFVPAMLNLAQLEWRQGEAETAAELYEQALALQPGNTSALLNVARFAAGSGDLPRAEELLEKLRKLDQAHVEGRLLLAQVQLALGKAVDALATVEEAVAIAPQDPQALGGLVNVLMRSGQNQRALAAMREFVAQHPEATGTRMLLAIAERRTGSLDAAEAILEGLAAEKLEPVFVATERVRIALERDRLDEAASSLEALDPDEVEPAVLAELRGDLAAKRGEAEVAAGHYAEAARARPTGDLAIKRHFATLKAGREDEAFDIIESWLVENPDDLMARLALAESRLLVGDKLPALSAYRAVTEQSPENEIAWTNLAWLTLDQGEPKASALAKTAHGKFPNNAYIADTYGWALVREGKIEEGVDVLRKAQALGDKLSDRSVGATINYHLGVGLARASDNRNAVAALERAVAIGGFEELAQAEELLQQLKN